MNSQGSARNDDVTTPFPTEVLNRAGAALRASAVATPADVIDGFRIIGMLGQGGMGVVYEAEQQNPSRHVALKVIRASVAGDRTLRRFARETQVLGRLEHPGIARIYAAGVAVTPAGSQPYFAMELIRGHGLLAFCADLATPQKLELLARICDAVAHAHANGVIHRDLKPGNILVDESGQPKVLDFGVARLTKSDGQQAATLQTETGQIIGTLAYMSPEQALGHADRVDERSDVYSLGVIGYQLLSGNMPYAVDGRTLPEVVRVIRDDDPEPLSALDRSLRGDVETILAKAMEKEPSRRYQSAGEMAADIRRHLAFEPITARPASTWYQLSRFTRRNRVLVGGIAATILALVVGTIVSLMQANRATANATRALQNEQRATSNEQAARQNALQALRRSSEQLILRGFERMDDGDLAGALPLFVQSLRINEVEAPDAALARSDRIRIDSVMRRLPRLPDDLPDAELPRWERVSDGRFIDIYNDEKSMTFTVRLVDLKTGNPLTDMLKHENPIEHALFSGDGRFFFTATRHGSVRIWESATGKLARPPLRHPQSVWRIALSPDERRIATACADGIARVWDLTDPAGKVVTTMRHDDWVNNCLFLSKGSRLLTISSDRTARIWDAATGKPVSPPMQHGGRAYSVAVSPDEKRIATSAEDGTTRLWEAETGRLVSASIQTGFGAYYLSFSADSRRLVTYVDVSREVRLWNADSGEPIGPPIRHPVSLASVACGPDNQILCRSSESSPDGHVRLRSFTWQVTDDATSLRLPHNVRQWGGYFGISDDFSLAAVLPTDHEIHIYELNKGTFVNKVPVNARPVHMMFNPARDRLVASLQEPGRSIGTSNEFVGWDISNARPIWDSPRKQRSLSTLVWSRDGSELFAGSDDPEGTIQIWDASTGEKKGSPLKLGAPVTDIFLDREGRSIFAHSLPGKSLRVWDKATRTVRDLPAFGGVLQPIFSDRTFTTSHADGSIRVWDVYDLRQLSLMWSRPEYLMTVARFSKDGRKLLFSGNDFIVRILDATTGQILAPPISERLGVRAGNFGDDDRLISTWSGRAARVWDVSTGLPVTPPLIHAAPLDHAHFIPRTNRLLTTAYSDSVVRFWDIQPDPRPIDELNRIAELMSCHRTDASGSLVRLTLDEWDDRRKQLRTVIAEPPPIPATTQAASNPAPR